MKIQLTGKEEIVEVSSAKGAEMIENGEGFAVPVHVDVVDVDDKEEVIDNENGEDEGDKTETPNVPTPEKPAAKTKPKTVTKNKTK